MSTNFIAAAVMSMACVMGLAHAARGQCDYSLTTYESTELVGYGVVSDSIVFDDGSGPALVIGGTELLAVPGSGSGQVYNIVKWTPKGGFTPVTEPNELYYTRDLEIWNGSLYATDQWSPLRWTGTSWVAVGKGLIGFVRRMITFDDAAGDGLALFVVTEQYVAPNYWSRLFKLDGVEWREVALFNDRFATMEAFGGRLLVAGGFTSVNGVPVNHIAAWDGTTWTDIGGSIGISVTDLIEHDVDGVPSLIACGSFTLPGSVTTDMARWDGSDWHALPEITVPNQSDIGPMGRWDNGDGPALYVAVTNMSVPTGDRSDTLFRFDSVAQQWQALGSTYRLPDSSISCMTPYQESDAQSSTLFVGGSFVQFANTDTYNLVRIRPQPSGEVEAIPSDPRALRGGVSEFAAFDDGRGSAIYAGGKMRGLGDAPSYTLVARFEGDSWTSIGRGGGTTSTLKTLKTLDDGTGPALYAAGSFPAIYPNDGTYSGHFARWQGSTWVGMGWPAHSTVNAICLHDDGDELAIYGALNSDTVGRWSDPNSAIVLPGVFSAGGTFGASLNALVSFDDGSGAALYVAGRIDMVSDVAVRNIARWRGSVDGWEPLSDGLPGEVTKLHVHNGRSGPLLIALGNVGQPGGLAQWDGKTWSAIGDLASIGLGGEVRSVATFDDGSGPALYASANNGVGRWNGSFWARLPREAAGSLLADGQVLYLGAFSIWAPDGRVLAINSITGGGSFDPGQTATLEVDVVHGGAVTYQWRHNGSLLTNISGYSGAFTPRLRIFTINGSHEGNYDVVVSNDCTTVTSAPIDVSVIGTCAGDITLNQTVDSADLVQIILAWGSCPQFGPCPADLTHNGVVDADDLTAVILAWGPCS